MGDSDNNSQPPEPSTPPEPEQPADADWVTYETIRKDDHGRDIERK